MRRLLLLLLLPLLVTGCATFGGDTDARDDFRSFVRADIEQARLIALNANPMIDEGAVYRLRCYDALLDWLPEPGAPTVVLPDVKGVVSAFEVAAQAKARADGGLDLVPVQVEAECAYIKDRLRRAGMSGAGRVMGIPGAGLLR